MVDRQITRLDVEADFSGMRPVVEKLSFTQNRFPKTLFVRTR